MIDLALKTLVKEKVRFVLGIAGVAFASFLMMFQMAILIGTFSQITKYIQKTDADIWVLQEGLSDITSSTSFVSSSNINRIETINGVERVTGLFLYYTSLRVQSNIANVFLVGYDSQSGIGGPWKILAGKTKAEGNNIIIDKDLAESEGLILGDEVTLAGRTATIAGISEETSAVATQYIFLSEETVRQNLNLDRIFNYLLVKCEEGSDISRIIEEINNIEGITAYTKAQLAENTLRFWGKFLIPLLSALIFASFLVGATVIGIIVHNITLHKEKEYGILLALGATSMHLYKTVFYQGAVLGACGFFVGIVLSVLAIIAANARIPGMTARLGWEVLSFSASLTILMIFISTLLPILRILKLDPFETFRG